jgi:hypothetical protein
VSDTPTDLEPRRRWVRPKQAEVDGPLSKSSLYKLAALHPGLFRKHGRCTFVDMWKLDEILAAAPPASIATSS